MNVAIVAPSPVPFVRGGAEGLFASLQRYIDAETPHACELIKLPSPEHDFWSVLGSYEAFSALDLSHFDLVISSKYPAWMVKHDGQAVYLLHRLRGLHDTYHLTGLPTRVDGAPAAVERLLAEMGRVPAGRAAHAQLPDFFRRLSELRDEDPRLFSHPGPLLREIVHHLDRIGTSPERVRRYAAISDTVRRRPDHFPSGVEVAVCHPPSPLEGFRCGSDEYLFTASRLDGPKRVALLIEAMRFVKADIPLLIAGAGPEEEKLRRLAARDSRIRLLGFVSDRRLVELYADALAVLYVPFEEDYGFITVEAMMSGKPVITTVDAGGPNELVHDGRTDFRVSPNPKAIARAIDRVCSDRAAARALGAEGRRLAETITWRGVVDSLLERPAARAVPPIGPRRQDGRLVVATTFPVYPPRGGGQARVFHLYRELAKDREVQIVSLAPSHEEPASAEIAPGVWEFRVPKSPEHERAERESSERVQGFPVTDIAMALHYRLTPAYADTLARAAEGARAVVASHPFTVHAIRAAAPAVPLWYEAHNVELQLKREMLGDRPGAMRLLEATEAAEMACWRQAELVFGCSAGDLRALAELYGARSSPSVEVPNGVDVGGVSSLPAQERPGLKARLGLGPRPLVVFMGSWHQPNIDAVQRIIGFAERLPEVNFMILGSACSPFEYLPLPHNVILTGVVDDEAKNLLVGSADLALNPMAAGSGTNLKMLDYFAVGTPVLTTPEGMRGLKVRAEEHAHVAALDEFPERIAGILEGGFAAQSPIIAAARELAAREYDWSVIAERFRVTLRSLPASATAANAASPSLRERTQGAWAST